MNVLLRTSVARRVAGLDVGGCVAGNLELVLRVLEVLAQVRWYPMQNELVLGEARGQPPRALDSAVVLGVTARLCQPVVGQIAVCEDVNFSSFVAVVLATVLQPRKHALDRADL